MGFGVLNGISIGLLNLSLGFNSVGFYQVGIVFALSWSKLNSLSSGSVVLNVLLIVGTPAAIFSLTNNGLKKRVSVKLIACCEMQLSLHLAH